MSARRIAVIGAGDVGSTLGGKWLAAGHDVVFGVRDHGSATVAALRAKLGEDVRTAAVGESIEQSDVVLIAVPGSAVEQLVLDYGPRLGGRVVIDATNQRVKGEAESSGQWGERKTMNSVGLLQAKAPGASVHRAFNSYSWEIFDNPVFGDLRADLFYCGQADEGQAAVEQLITDVGLRPVRLGGLDCAEDVDHVLGLWAALAIFEGKGRANLAFTVLQR